jgi:hypothetical protein
MTDENDLLAVSLSIHLALDFEVGEVVVSDFEVVVTQTPV